VLISTFSSSHDCREVLIKTDIPALELSKRLLHPLDRGVHLLLDDHPVAGQGGSAPLQVLHRTVNVGSWGEDI